METAPATVDGGTAGSPPGYPIAGESNGPHAAGSPPGHRSRRRRLALELIPTALLAIAVAGGLWGFSYDDAFITYRYAENWSAGRGLVFNPGEVVLGTTAPGWALLLGALERASAALGIGGLGVPEWGTLLTVAALWWLSAALPALWLPAASPLRPGLPLLLGLLALTCRWNLELLGAEAFPAAALAATAVWLAFRRNAGGGEIAAGLAVAAAMLFRLDAALAAAAIGVALWVRRRGVPWRFAAAGLAPVVPYLLWLEARFGSAVPNTLAGKRGEASLAPLGYAASAWAWVDRAFGGPGRAALIALAAVGAAWLLWRATAAYRQRSRSRPAAGRLSPVPGPLAVIAGWLLLHEAFYRAAGVPFAPWYHVATLNALLALAVAAVVALLPPLARAVQEKLPWGLYPAIIAVLVAPAIVILPGIIFLTATWGTPPDVRTRVYAAVGRHLREHSPPGARVAAMEIGALACAADRPVLDLIGLVSPDVLRARAAGRLPEHVAEAAPEYILVPPPFLGRELGDVMRHPEIRARYRPAARFFDPAYQHDPMTLYRRRESAPASGPGSGR